MQCVAEGPPLVVQLGEWPRSGDETCMHCCIIHFLSDIVLSGISKRRQPVHRTAAAASAAASPSSHHCAAASAAAAASSAAASRPSASFQPTAAGLNNGASLTTDEYPPSVQELVMNGFELSKVLRAYDLVGDSFDDLLSVLLSSTTT